jgi:hypothetical protein
MSTLSHERQRTTVPSFGWYTAISATWTTAPHPAQVPTAVVISVPNSSISSPPIALPSSTPSSSAAITDLHRANVEQNVEQTSSRTSQNVEQNVHGVPVAPNRSVLTRCGG